MRNDLEDVVGIKRIRTMLKVVLMMRIQKLTLYSMIGSEGIPVEE
jgi:hypothetical protein